MEPLRISCSYRRLRQIVHRTAPGTMGTQPPRGEANCSEGLGCSVPDRHRSIRTYSLKHECGVFRRCTSTCSIPIPNAATLSSGGMSALPTSSPCVQSISTARHTFPTQSSFRDADCFLRTYTASHEPQRSYFSK